MKNASDNKQNKNTTSKSDSTENSRVPANRSSGKKGKTPSQRRRVQLAYALLTLIALSLFILMVLLPRPGSQAPAMDREAERTPEKETTRTPEGEKSQQVGSEPLKVSPGLDEPEDEPESTDPDGPIVKPIEPEGYPEGDADGSVSEGERSSEGERLTIQPLEKIAAPPAGGAKLYLVIDDVGYSLEQLDTYLDLPIPMTFALLPGLDFSRAAQEQIARSGEEMILHQPIEPMGDEDPGPGALYVGMRPEEMRNIVNKNLDQLSQVIGVNNHMGSKGTANPELMEALFSVLKGRQLYFLDSRTTADTVGNTVAEKLGVPFSERNVFLDNIEDSLEIELALSSALEIARTQGYAVMIGHVWSRELASTLSLWYGEIEDRGYEFVHLSSFFAEEHAHAGNGN